jgi:hypothetical protein
VGVVSDTVKGSGPKKKSGLLGKKKGSTDGKNLIEHLRGLHEEIGELTSIKDDDTLTEGADEKAENMRKAGLLRACASLVKTCQNLMEEY